MTFPEFLRAWREGTLDEDAAWRAYDILAHVRHVQAQHISMAYQRSALKALKLAYAGELALPEFMARYGFENRSEATLILGCWWVWSGIDAGRRMGAPRRPQEGVGLST